MSKDNIKKNDAFHALLAVLDVFPSDTFSFEEKKVMLKNASEEGWCSDHSSHELFIDLVFEIESLQFMIKYRNVRGSYETLISMRKEMFKILRKNRAWPIHFFHVCMATSYLYLEFFDKWHKEVSNIMINENKYFKDIELLRQKLCAVTKFFGRNASSRLFVPRHLWEPVDIPED